MREQRPDGSSSLAIAAGLGLGATASVGLGRFAYGLVLPAMRADLDWSYTTAGLVNVANMAGYLIGALVADRLARQVGARLAFVGSMALCTIAVAATAAVPDTALVTVWRLVAGAAGAVTFVVGGALATHLASRSKRHPATVLGVYIAGVGAGIVLTGLLVPPVLGETQRWRLAWLALAVISVAAIWPADRAARRVQVALGATYRHGPQRLTGIGPLLISYTLFGAGYIAYMTFVVAYLVAEAGLSSTMAASFWVVLGLAAAGTAFVSPAVMRRQPGGSGVAIILLGVTIGAALPLVWPMLPGALGSALLFGGGFLSVVTAVATVSRAVLPPEQWSRGFAVLTIGFALGQSAGPALAGLLSDTRQGIAAGQALSVVVLAIAAGIALFQRSTAFSR